MNGAARCDDLKTRDDSERVPDSYAEAMFLVVSQHTRSRRSGRRAILRRNGPDADLDDHKGVPMQRSTMTRMGAVGGVCALVGGAAGSFSSLSGEKLTITEGTKTATYKTLTLTIPSGAAVTRNGEAAKLSDLKSGDMVMVAQSPQGTDVAAHDAQHPDVLQLKLRVPQKGEHRFPLPRPPGMPEEGSSSHSGEGAAAPETGASS
jgi:hypothetical protein